MLCCGVLSRQRGTPCSCQCPERLRAVAEEAERPQGRQDGTSWASGTVTCRTPTCSSLHTGLHAEETRPGRGADPVWRASGQCPPDSQSTCTESLRVLGLVKAGVAEASARQAGPGRARKPLFQAFWVPRGLRGVAALFLFFFF